MAWSLIVPAVGDSGVDTAKERRCRPWRDCELEGNVDTPGEDAESCGCDPSLCESPLGVQLAPSAWFMG